MFESLIDQAFKRALEKGEFDNLPGSGKPISQESLMADPFAHVLAESGAITPFGLVQRCIDEARARLASTTDQGTRRALEVEISTLETRKAIEMETWKRNS